MHEVEGVVQSLTREDDHNDGKELRPRGCKVLPDEVVTSCKSLMHFM